MVPMLQVNGLVKEYKNYRAVNDLSFTIKPGEIVALLGPNGAGKTTALRCIAGILRPTHGQILINGHDLINDQMNAKRGLAFVPEVPSLYDLLTVYEHLRFVAMCFDNLEKFEREHETLLRKYHLWEKKNDLVATLSKGMRQKLSVACAMIHDANIFLFDEPLIGIDPAGSHELKQELFQARANGASILVSTHLLDTVERLCDRIMIMARGKLLAEGTTQELQELYGMQDKSLEDLFLMLTSEAE
ncbi:MAG: ATP-binding cassette domain-containing protein [Armatimonadetes bacterium]|nr:ATP-binding cassette domain-containing protein [Armatimonadota bacterium]